MPHDLFSTSEELCDSMKSFFEGNPLIVCHVYVIKQGAVASSVAMVMS